jgi:hypothetical protein
MQEFVTDEPRNVRPMLGNFVSNGWSGAMLEEGIGMILMGVLMGAFCGLILGLITLQLTRFVSFATGRNLGGVGWTLICMALGAMAFGIMTARNAD